MEQQRYEILFKVARLCWRVSPKLAQWVNDVGEGLAYYRMRRWSHSHSEAKATGFMAVGVMPSLIASEYQVRDDQCLWWYLAQNLIRDGKYATNTAHTWGHTPESVRENLRLLCDTLGEEAKRVRDADAK